MPLEGQHLHNCYLGNCHQPLEGLALSMLHISWQTTCKISKWYSSIKAPMPVYSVTHACLICSYYEGPHAHTYSEHQARTSGVLCLSKAAYSGYPTVGLCRTFIWSLYWIHCMQVYLIYPLTVSSTQLGTNLVCKVLTEQLRSSKSLCKETDVSHVLFGPMK